MLPPTGEGLASCCWPRPFGWPSSPNGLALLSYFMIVRASQCLLALLSPHWSISSDDFRKSRQKIRGKRKGAGKRGAGKGSRGFTACTLHGPPRSWLPRMACLLVRISACTQGPLMALPVLTPSQSCHTPPTIEACRMAPHSSRNPLLFLVTGRPLVCAHMSPGVAAPVGAPPRGRVENALNELNGLNGLFVRVRGLELPSEGRRVKELREAPHL